MPVVYGMYKEHEADLKNRLQEHFPHILELDLREYSDEELQRFPVTLTPTVAHHGEPIIVIYMKLKTHFERLYDDGIARKYMEYRYYIFTDGFADGFIPSNYKQVITAWLSSL